MKWKHSDVFSVAVNKFAPVVTGNDNNQNVTEVNYGGVKEEKVNIVGVEMQQSLIVEGEQAQAQMQAAGSATGYSCRENGT